VGAKLSYADENMDGRADGQTGMTKLTVAFHNFENAPKYPQIKFSIANTLYLTLRLRVSTYVAIFRDTNNNMSGLPEDSRSGRNT
jgi:hypothetical protein